MLKVQRWDAGRDGVLTAGRVRERFEAQGLWVSEGTFQPGANHVLPGTGHDQLHVVLSGLLKVTIAGDSALLAAGDAVFMPRGTDSTLEVVGTTPVVACFAAFLPNAPRISRAAPPDLTSTIWR